jgi:hypothetical protein
MCSERLMKETFLPISMVLFVYLQLLALLGVNLGTLL